VLIIDTLLGDVAGMLGAAKEFFTLAAVNDYSRAQEEAADLQAVRTMHAAGIDPAACRTFFERLRADADALENSEALAWISTHPSHAERIAAIDAEIARLGPVTTVPLAVDWAAVRAALGEAPKADAP
jgi:predicted Zn-dependent protease